MNQRDELTAIIDDRWHGYGYNPQGAADAILAKGYRKTRTITAVEELDALPDGTVVRTGAGTVVNIVGDSLYLFNNKAATPRAFLALPATVLYSPVASGE